MLWPAIPAAVAAGLITDLALRGALGGEVRDYAGLFFALGCLGWFIYESNDQTRAATRLMSAMVCGACGALALFAVRLVL